MNRTVLAIVALAVIALLGFGIYSNVSNRDTTPEVTSNDPTPQTAVQAQSLEDFMSSADNQQCTFSDSEAKTSGTIYVSNGQLRGDFTTDSDDMQVTDEVSAHVIANNESVYLWMDGVEDGYKTSFDSVSELSDDLPIGDIVNPDSNVDYECTAWTVDASVFELPDKEFADLSGLLEGIGGNENNALQCAACDSLSGEAQTQCRSALSCN